MSLKIFFKNEDLKRKVLLCKAKDSFLNLSIVDGILSEESIIKNVKETYDLLFSVMKK